MTRRFHSGSSIATFGRNRFHWTINGYSMSHSLSLPVLSSLGFLEKRQGLSSHCLRCQWPLSSFNESSISVPPTLPTSLLTALAQSSAWPVWCLSGALEVDDHATGDTHNVSRCSTEVVVPRSRSSPHLVVLQQVRINEHTQLCAVTKGRHAAVGLGNPSSNAPSTWHY